jgi:hypothetical protein
MTEAEVERVTGGPAEFGFVSGGVVGRIHKTYRTPGVDVTYQDGRVVHVLWH